MGFTQWVYTMGFTRWFYSDIGCSHKRIGPHSQDVISTLVGNLLGDGWGESRAGSTRFHIHMSTRNVAYLSWLHGFYKSQGYCSEKRPCLSKHIGPKGKVYYSLKFRTWSFQSLNWLYEMFYTHHPDTRDVTKHIPHNIGDFLTPRALAIWCMDDGGATTTGFKISTESFSREDIRRVQHALSTRYGIETRVHRHGVAWVVYFSYKSAKKLYDVIEQHLHVSMKYKFRCIV
jgi:hypothetical protein